MGCSVSVVPQEEAKDLEPEIEALEVPWIEPNYPPPNPPKTRSSEVFAIEDFADIDERATHCPAAKTESYDALLTYLTRGLITDMEKVRSIFTWLGSQNIAEGHFKSQDVNTPAGYMKLMKEKRGSYSTFLALLLRKVNIPCVIVYGISKSFDYDVGDRDIYHLRNCWNTVYVDGHWRLIHPLWSFRKVTGFNKGRWQTIRKDIASSKKNDEEKEEEGTNIFSQDEFFFLVEPSVFIHMCRPAADMAAWQLLKQPWSFEEFIRAPVLRQKFFQYNLALTSKPSCILQADEHGIVQITFEDLEEPEMSFVHQLYFDDRASFNKLPANVKLERYAYVSRKQSKVTVKARLPVGGIYKLRIYGGVGDLYHLCDFRLESETPNQPSKPFPFSKRLMYGFTKTSRVRGLDYPSEFGGVIRLQAGQGKIFTFAYLEELDIQAIFEHHMLTRDDLKKCIAVKRKEGYFNIYVNVPASEEIEEYSLQIYTRPRGSNGQYVNAVNYLLIMARKPEEPKVNIRKVEKYYEMEARRNLKTAIERSNIGELDIAIQRVQRLRMESEDDLIEAKRKRELLILERDLRLAIARRRPDFLDRVLDRAARLTEDHHLDYLVKEACDIREQLRRLITFLHDVLEIHQPTISEMHNYKRPKEVIHNIMLATYLLLGEDEEDLMRWDYIQHLMRKVGRNSLISRLRKFDVVSVQLDILDRVQSIIDMYDEDAVRQASSGAGTFYVWCQNIVVELTVSIHNEIQKYRARRG
ncbi:lim and transglutaminase domain protein ltd-1-like [Haliotis cracherodii]|uniref:lim and transglutaminase domain protein ltd-1-like n=1 Tax=Haliotis cracherodii TaxID=6455 RepID=UPI0039E80C92